jgi:regulator of cell morphogenesis and NO signaling
MTIHPRQSVASVVFDHSECAPVLRRHKIDFSCPGDPSIASACHERGLDPWAVIEELEIAVLHRAYLGRGDPRRLPTPELVAQIRDRHHAALRGEPPFLQDLARQIARWHGDDDPSLRALESELLGLSDKLVPHLDFEDDELFPSLLSGRADPYELAAVLDDHADIIDRARRLREAARDFRLPPAASPSHHTLFSELRELEREIFRHVRVENHVLLPRFWGAGAAT